MISAVLNMKTSTIKFGFACTALATAQGTLPKYQSACLSRTNLGSDDDDYGKDGYLNELETDKARDWKIFSKSEENKHAKKERAKTYDVQRRTFAKEFSTAQTILKIVNSSIQPTKVISELYKEQLDRFDEDCAKWQLRWFDTRDFEADADADADGDVCLDSGEERRRERFRERYERFKEAYSIAFIESDLGESRSSSRTSERGEEEGEEEARLAERKYQKRKDVMIRILGEDLELNEGTIESLDEMLRTQPKWPTWPWETWRRLVIRGMIRDCCVTSVKVLVSKFLERRTTDRLTVKLTKDFKMSAKRKMARIFNSLRTMSSSSSSSSSSSGSRGLVLSYTMGEKWQVAMKFARTTFLANFCHNSAILLYGLFEDAMRCFNFWRLGGYKTYKVPSEQCTPRACLRLYLTSCVTKHVVSVASNAISSMSVACITFYLVPAFEDGKFVWTLFFLSSNCGDLIAQRLSTNLNEFFGFNGLPRLSSSSSSPP